MLLLTCCYFDNCVKEYLSNISSNHTCETLGKIQCNLQLSCFIKRGRKMCYVKRNLSIQGNIYESKKKKQQNFVKKFP